MKIFQKQVKQLSDEELMKMLSKGNQKAFDEIYVRYSEILFGYFMKMLARDKEKCEDMVHDLFAKIIRKPDYFDVNRSFRTWVFSVACNMCKNEYKRMSVRKHVSNDFEPTKSMQINEGTVKSRLFYATKTLASELKEFNPIYNQ
jgi:RNA polymerase sigma-70 factor (ECF subfamily)